MRILLHQSLQCHHCLLFSSNHPQSITLNLLYGAWWYHLCSQHTWRGIRSISRVPWSSMNSLGGLGCPQRQRGKSQCLVPATRNGPLSCSNTHSADRLEAIGQYDLGSFAAFATSDRSALASSFSLVASGHKTYRLRHIKTVTVERSELQHQDVAAMSKKTNRQCSKPWWHSIILYTDGLAILPAYHQRSKYNPYTK